MSYLTSSSIRNYTHTEIHYLLTGELDDGTSQASISFDGNSEPEIEFRLIRRRNSNNLHFVVNGDVRGPLHKTRGILSDDRVFSAAGHFLPSENTMLVYKALTKAINQGKISFEGKFDCVKTSIPGNSGRSVEITADTLIPYIYSSSSNIRGTVEFRRTYNVHGDSREIIVINVTGEGERPDIPNGSLVYLGGKDHTIDSQNDLEPYETGVIYISSPFPNVWKRSVGDHGPNVCITELQNGEYGYWSTRRGVKLEQNVMQLSSEVFAEIEGKHVGDIEEFDFKMKNAWVLKGIRLSPNTAPDISVPSEVLEMLQCGFFYSTPPFSHKHFFSFEKRVRRLLEQVGKLGAHMFGLVRHDDGIHCDITALSSAIGLSVDHVLNLMSRMMGMEKYFGGSVDFFFPEEKEIIGDPRNMFIITGPVPFSNWMSGNVIETGVGLLFVENTMTYYDVEEVDGVGLLSVYKGPPKTRTRELNVQFIMSKK